MPPSEAASETPKPITNFPSFLGLLWRGFTRRCAWCGNNKAYFIGWFRRTEKCCNCRHGYRRGDAAFELGAITANIIITFMTMLIAIPVLIVATSPDVPVLWVTIAVAAIGVVVPAVAYPLSFTVWQAVDLIMRPPTEDELAGRGDTKL